VNEVGSLFDFLDLLLLFLGAFEGFVDVQVGLDDELLLEIVFLVH